MAINFNNLLQQEKTKEIIQEKEQETLPNNKNLMIKFLRYFNK